MRLKANSLTVKTLSYLITFSVVILFLLWLIQVGFLKVFFEREQMRNIHRIAEEIIAERGDLNSKLEALAYESDICVEVYLGDVSYSYNLMSRDCLLKSKAPEILSAKLELLYSSKAKYLLKVNNPLNRSKSLIYGLRLNENMYVFLNTQLEDVNSTNAVLRSQLIYINLLVIALAVTVAYFVSKMLNKPILRITAQAQKLATGNYEQDLEDYGIAEINELKTVLNYARSEAKNTDELRRDLMANVSHDLKTPLTMIKAYAEMAKDINGKNTKKRNENLAVIIAETDRLNSLVNDILDLSKLQSGNAELKLEDYDLVYEIKEILRRYELIKETENYQFITEIPTVAMVKADRNKINQVIYNLINNAVNYTGEDLTIKINVKEQKNHYLFEVIDTGKGIKPEDIRLIWSKYYKKEKNHQRNIVGTGLGLSIVKNILTEHNFAHGVESTKEKGTRFYFQINKGQKN